ncbi:MAG TPA: BBE domain-containing protein [Nitriliruptorales bacterium]
MRRVAVDATAFAHRDHGVMFSAAVKRAYDPTNLFHHNVNVPPSPDGA